MICNEWEALSLQSFDSEQCIESSILSFSLEGASHGYRQALCTIDGKMYRRNVQGSRVSGLQFCHPFLRYLACVCSKFDWPGSVPSHTTLKCHSKV